MYLKMTGLRRHWSTLKSPKRKTEKSSTRLRRRKLKMFIIKQYIREK